MHGHRPLGMKNVDRVIYEARLKHILKLKLFHLNLPGFGASANPRLPLHTWVCFLKKNVRHQSPPVARPNSFLFTYLRWRVARGHTCFTAVISLFDLSSSPKLHLEETLCLFVPLLLPSGKRHHKHNTVVPSVQRTQRGREHLHLATQQLWSSQLWSSMQKTLWENRVDGSQETWG